MQRRGGADVIRASESCFEARGCRRNGINELSLDDTHDATRLPPLSDGVIFLLRCSPYSTDGRLSPCLEDDGSEWSRKV